MFSSTATIHVIPNPKKIKFETSCLITAVVCEEIARYYREQTNKALHIGLLKPSWDAHITISKVNPPEIFDVAMCFDKETVRFDYDPNVRYSGDTTKDKPDIHWFIDVFSDDIRAIRGTLGLPDYNKFHVTIGIRNGR